MSPFDWEELTATTLRRAALMVATVASGAITGHPIMRGKMAEPATARGDARATTVLPTTVREIPSTSLAAETLDERETAASSDEWWSRGYAPDGLHPEADETYDLTFSWNDAPELPAYLG